MGACTFSLFAGLDHSYGDSWSASLRSFWLKSSVQPHFGFYNPGLSSYDPIFGLQDRNKVLQSFVQTSPKLQARSSPRPVSKTTCCSAPNPHSSYRGLTFASFDHARRTRLEQIEVMLLSAASEGAPPFVGGWWILHPLPLEAQEQEHCLPTTSLHLPSVPPNHWWHSQLLLMF